MSECKYRDSFPLHYFHPEYSLMKLNPVVKKTLWMIALSTAIFLILLVLDQSEVSKEHFFAFGPSRKEKALEPQVERELLTQIRSFNSALSLSYRTLDSSPLSVFQLEDAVLKPILMELEFFQKDGRIMELDVKEIKIESAKQRAPTTYDVVTNEVTSVLYRNRIDGAEGKEIEVLPEEVFRMRYSLELLPSGWKIHGVDRMKDKRDEK